jgi:hypothetical protein
VLALRAITGKVGKSYTVTFILGILPDEARIERNGVLDVFCK